MRKQLIATTAAVACALAAPAWCAGRGAAGGHAGASAGAAMGGAGQTLGPATRQAALDARMNGQPVGPSVRAAARVNARGPEYANQNAITHVQDSPGQANANSVLASGASGDVSAATSATRSGTSASAATTDMTGAGPTGATTRTTARANAQGPQYANPAATSHVQGSPGRAGDNSVLGSPQPSTATGDTIGSTDTGGGGG